MTMRTYPHYRDSGVECLGEVPEHWEVRPLKRWVSLTQTGSTPPTQEAHYFEGGAVPWHGPSSFGDGLLLRESARKISKSAIRDGIARLFDEESSMIVTIGATIGKVGFVDEPSSCNQQITAVTFDTSLIAPKFGAYQLKPLEPMLRSIAPNTTLPILNQSQVQSLAFAAPPKSEQSAIAAFLDRETARIDALVEKKRLLIERLEEYRTALITRTVTRGLPPEAARAAGLDPSPRLNPSGVEWLGSVPAHWETTRLSRVIDCLDGRRIPLNAEQRADFQGEYPYWGTNGVLDYVAEWLFDEPLVLLGEDGAPFFGANKRVAFSVSGKIWVNNHAHVLRPTGIHPEFLTHVLNTTEFAFFIDGSTRDKLTQGQMNSIPVPLPPLHEQREITKFLHQEAGQIDSLVERVETNIERLQEHRSALITAAVTGKIDVREQMTNGDPSAGGAP